LAQAGPRVFTSTFAAISCRAPFPRIILLEDRNKQFGQKRANGRIPMRDTTTNQERAFSASAPSLPRRAAVSTSASGGAGNLVRSFARGDPDIH